MLPYAPLLRVSMEFTRFLLTAEHGVTDEEFYSKNRFKFHLKVLCQTVNDLNAYLAFSVSGITRLKYKLQESNT